MCLRFALLLIACYSVNAAVQLCPPGWTEYNDNCYRYFSFKKSWYAAQAFCDTVGSRGFSQGSSYQTSELTSILNLGEQSFLHNFWQSCSQGEGSLWTGLNDPRHNRVFEWVDGSPLLYTNWNSGEPNNYENRGEYYGAMFSNGKWNDEHASSEKMFSFICKMPRQGKCNC